MRPLIILLAVAITLVAGVTTLRLQRQRDILEVFTPEPASPNLPVLWPLPEFSLIERSGETVTQETLRGHVWVADFFYTTCPGPCPMLSSRLSELHAALARKPEVRLVSISTDPQKDTPEVLQTYAQQFRASERWLFLTGPKEAIFRLANEGFKLALVEDPGAKEPITHSTKLVLVDRAGRVRGFYDGLAKDQERLRRDVARLEKE